MRNPLAYATCIVVRSAKDARDLQPFVKDTVYITWPGANITGLAFSTILVIPSPPFFLADPRNLEWFNHSVRPSLAINGRIIGDPYDETA